MDGKIIIFIVNYHINFLFFPCKQNKPKQKIHISSSYTSSLVVIRGCNKQAHKVKFNIKEKVKEKHNHQKLNIDCKSYIHLTENNNNCNLRTKFCRG